MKKDYSQPSIAMEQANLEMIICGSQSITSDNGITYGGVSTLLMRCWTTLTMRMSRKNRLTVWTPNIGVK